MSLVVDIQHPRSPKDGVYINFYFNGNISDEVKLEFYDKSGQLIKSFDKGSKDKKNTG